LVSRQGLETSPAPSRRRRYFHYVLYLGLALRLFVFLFQDPYNNDNHIQIIDWIRTQGSIPPAAQFSQAYHPPLYHLLAQLFYLGDGSFLSLKLLQLFSLLTSLLTFVALYRLIDRFFQSERIRLFSALFVALLPQFIMFGNYVSMDSLANFLGALLLWLAVLYMEKPTLARKIGLAVVLGLGLSTKGTFLALAPLVWLWVVIVERRAGRGVKTVLTSLLLVVALSAALGSYKYVDNWRLYGKPFIHNTDPLVQKATGWPWARPQMHTYVGWPSLLDWNVGKLVLHPTLGETTRHSYFLLLYGTFWYQYIPESNLTGNLTKFRALGSLIYILALLPTLVLILGGLALAAKIRAAVRSRKIESDLLAQIFSGLAFLGVLGLVVFIGVRTDVWSCFQSRLTFPALGGLIVLFAFGLEVLERRPTLARAAYFLLTILWGCFILYFLIEFFLGLGVFGRV